MSNGKTRNRCLLQVISLIQEKRKRLLEEKKMVQNDLLSVHKWYLNIISLWAELIHLINESLAIPLAESLGETGFVYLFTFSEQVFRMRSSVATT